MGARHARRADGIQGRMGTRPRGSLPRSADGHSDTAERPRRGGLDRNDPGRRQLRDRNRKPQPDSGMAGHAHGRFAGTSREMPMIALSTHPIHAQPSDARAPAAFADATSWADSSANTT